MKHSNSELSEFSCHAPKATAVFVAGTLNNWKPDVLPMHPPLQSADWFITLPLPPGHHEFKVIVDGQWCCEPGCKDEYRGCAKCIPNEFGTMNRVLEVR
jgi:5'-AMP-activated protein kinase regulatory beta subunit